MIFSSDNVRPSTVVNSRDCGAIVTIAASFSVTLCLIFYAARLLVRWPWRALFRYDDMVITFATALALIQSILAIEGVSAGLGVVPEDLEPGALLRIDKLVFSTQILFVIVTNSCKIAACLLIHRLTCHKSQRISALAVVLTSAIFCLVSLLVLNIGVGSGSPWTNEQNDASTLTNRWVAYAIMANLIDLCIVALAIALVYNLEMKRSRKFNIVAIFALRLGIIPISILRIARLSHALRSDIYNYAYVSVEVYTQVEMCYNVLTATLPSLTMFLASAHTGLLELGASDKAASTYGSASRRYGNGTPRATLRSNNNGGSRVGGSSKGHQGVVEAFELTEQAHGGSSAAVTADKEQHNRGSLSSDDSEMAIIRVKRTVSLRYGE